MPAIAAILFLILSLSSYADGDYCVLSARSQLDTVGKKPLTLVIKKENLRESRSKNVSSSRIVEYEDWAGKHQLHEEKVLSGNFNSVFFSIEGEGEGSRISFPVSLGEKLITYLHSSPDWVFNCYGFVAFMNGFDSSVGEMDLESADIENLNTLQTGRTVRIGVKTGSDFIPYHYAIYLGHGLFLSKMGSGGKLVVHDAETLLDLYQKKISFQVVFLKSSEGQSQVSA